LSTTIVMHRTDTTGSATSRVTLDSDDDWDGLPSTPDVTYTAACDEPHCLNAGGVHALDWGAGLQHTAFSWTPDGGCAVQVLRLPDSTDARFREWVVEGFIHDEDLPLTPQRVGAFMAHYNSAVTLADELNGDLR
jgi:hypothetical protein